MKRLPAFSRRRSVARGFRHRTRLLALSLSGVLLVSVAQTAAALPAAALPAAPAPAPGAAALPAGPPTDTTVVIQSVGGFLDGEGRPDGLGGGGYQISGTELLFRATPPKGDEADQWWYLQPSRTVSGAYQVKSRTKGDRCMGRDSNSEGEARLAFRDCAGSGTDWLFERVKGERYKIHPVGYEETLQTPAKVDQKDRKQGGDVTFASGPQGNADSLTWYVTQVEPPHQAMPADPTFDQRTFLTSHNAFNNQEDADGGAPLPNQPHSIRKQLANGVRALMLDAAQSNGRVRMCHGGACLPTFRPLSDVFTDIADFLKAPGNEKEIITVFMEDYTSYADLNAEVGDDLRPGGQLHGMVFNPETQNVRTQGWPRLSKMAADNTRLLLFTDKGVGPEAEGQPGKRDLGFQHQADWTTENYWSMGSGIGNSDWTCRTRWDGIPLSQEEKGFRRLSVMNHFRDGPVDGTAGTDNEKVLNRAQRFCSPASRRKPNFLAVDRYQSGNPMSAVDTLNTYAYSGDTPGFGGTPDEPADNWTVPRLAVMPLGDSITEGAGSTTRSSYRAELWNLLKGRAPVIDFVGSQKHGQLPDTDHEGHSGWLIEGLAANIDTWLAEAKPNVVLLHIGTNDMDRDHQVATAPARLAALIDQIIAASPDTAIAVSSLVPSASPAVQSRINAYNATIPGIVAARQGQGHKVSYVNMSTALTTGDLNDRLHPNNAGYLKMARVFSDGVSHIAQQGQIVPEVVVRPAPPRTSLGDYQVDLNADGRADYLVVEENGAVRAWLNKGGNGRGGWTDAGRIASGVGAPGSQVRFADLNGDAYADYLVVDPAGAVHAWLNKGGTGTAGWTDAGQVASGVGAPGSTVRFADLNADRRADYLVVDANGAVRAWLNKGGTGTAGWTEAGQIASGVGAPADQLRFADVNADGYADYLVVDANGAVRAWLNKGGTGTAGWTDTGQIASGTHSPGSSVRFADLNADRRADYLVVDANGAVRAWLNNGGDGTGVGTGWTPSGTMTPGPGDAGSQVRFADINADGRPDYLIVNAAGAVRAWLNNGPVQGGWTLVGQITAGVGAPADQVRLADINADGRADYLAVAADGSVRAWLNNGGDGQGGWTPLGTYASGTDSPGSSVRFADVNADGRADYLAVAADGSVRAWLNNGGDGQGGWSPGFRLASGTGATGDQVRFADVNADGRADYLAVAADGSAKAWLNKDGKGAWTPLGAYAPGVGAPGAQVQFADVNGDGRADYLTVAPDGSAGIWLNNGGELTGGWAGLGTIASGAGAPASQVRI